MHLNLEIRHYLNYADNTKMHKQASAFIYALRYEFRRVIHRKQQLSHLKSYFTEIYHLTVLDLLFNLFIRPYRSSTSLLFSLIHQDCLRSTHQIKNENQGNTFVNCSRAVHDANGRNDYSAAAFRQFN